MKKSAFYSDILFTFFLSALFTLCVFRYFGVRLFPAVFLSALCGVLAACAVGSWLQTRRKHFFLKKSDEAQKQKLLLHLTLLSDDKKTEFFREALSNSALERSPYPNPLLKRFGKLRLQAENAFYFLSFRFAPVTADEIVRMHRLKTSRKKVLLCGQIEEDAFALCQKLGVEVKTGEAVYTLLKSKDALPKEYLGEESGGDKKKKRLRLCFAKTNSRRFLVSGALILLASLFTPFGYYYVFLGFILLLASLFVRIFGYS